MTQKCIIIGASHAAAQLITSLKQEGWKGDVLVISDEPYLPYHRPPLSKAFLSGEKSSESLVIRPTEFYEKHGVNFVQGRVTAINRQQKILTLGDGKTFTYDKLALCTGARARKIDLPGCHLKGIHYLRDMDDAKAIKANVVKGQHAVIVGGGYIGLETAASLIKLGMQVTLLETASRILQRVTAPEVSDFYQRVHSENGVSIHTNVTVTGFDGHDYIEKVLLADGTELSAHLVVVGVGVEPNVELAEMASLVVDNGILVDDFCRTNDRNIVAAGDGTNQFNKIYGRRIRLESVPNANAQAKIAAASICDLDKGSVTLPWFWSDQYDLKLQIAGLSQGYDEIIFRGDRLTGYNFTAFYLKEGQLIAADCVNRPQDFMLSKKLITQKTIIPLNQLLDDSIPLKTLLLNVS
ncbi:MAG: NAD(P)/FAD-dependent oxidoreductase [Glaciecola sp.]|jgi:3-phenylpropionate/trans-cinnamate dioxygenase ferredoxin reductase subunit|uniref:Ferredoxin reductase n=1 Tax=Paraglaciecola chathamensis TaxID=368405 RepID=A0A8H9IE73_9ALTE|nr:FAD/NAD(P)-binding oxidoreductase [Paraglaciecola oceanifecundans]MAI64626.1 pyridine nucleotide-disulfide oxidoreductase [Alteromonas sp.]GGZ83974.1 putative ferredoxin reductase [Paraglaciecola oceanifecundans]|tara:strand:+ start:1811 stop:3037 length:1227 start_codon:yes stop_codon:yes gene_type:complete